jgi:hypothetical protein
MTTPENTTTEDLKRIPGLFRRWELPEIFEANCDYHIEDAGTHVDGTPLVALYSSGAQVNSGASSKGGKRESDDPRDVIPVNLLSKDVIAALPLTLEIGVAHKLLPLFSVGGATVGDLGLAINNLGQMLQDEGRKVDALSLLHQELVAHGADVNAGVFEMLAIIATPDGDTEFVDRPEDRTTSRTPISHPRPRAAGTVRNRPE